MSWLDDDGLAGAPDVTTDAQIPEYDWGNGNSTDLAQLAKYGFTGANEYGTDTANDGSDAKFYKTNDPSLLASDLENSGVSGDLWKMVSGVGSAVSSGIDKVSGWLSSNPKLAQALLSGLSYAEQQQLLGQMKDSDYKRLMDQLAAQDKYTKENMGLSNQYRIDAENRQHAYDQSLWQRRNDNITGMKINAPGIITAAQLQPLVDSIRSK